ncbi:MAG: UMP kinase [Patescibacteria group bacterium]
MRHPHKERILISLGGSLLVPDEIDWRFISRFKRFIIKHIHLGYSFILVTGGGRTARKYIEAAAKISKITDDDSDWLGIHATRMNAHFIRTVFRTHAHARINTNPHNLEDFYDVKEPILVAAGWRPGCSTDYDAVLLGKYLDVKRIINLSNIDYVYDKDPRKHPDAKKIRKISWKAFRKIVGDKWNPGMSAPFDPIASKLAEAEDMEVAILNGENLENIEKYLAHKSFIGTVIR